jgi:predicted KAP-like P-loop ATPase
MPENILSDQPVQNENEDRFQRYNFSKRIAKKILDSEASDSIVIGIYGAWGEGKTSVINFIENELKSDESIIPIRFNPWRFTEESTLLVSFFNTLAYEIKKSFPEKLEKNHNSTIKWLKQLKRRWYDNREPLKTNIETIGGLIEKYGKVVSVFGAGEAAESLGKILTDVNLDTIKTRFENLLIKSKKKLVIFIDDIDRLEKQEIHSIFRLVKLTGNFSNTFYVLAFDQEMVAAAIGERFGEGDKQSGYSFLEKIIQVPLEIPLAQPDALKSYCFKLVDKAILENKVELTKPEIQRFVSEFNDNILIRLKTPRLATQYGNTLSFSFPLLLGEVNLVDLMLVEALKVFYPKHYRFVKEQSYYFLTSYSHASAHYDKTEIEAKKKDLLQFLDQLGVDLSKKENETVKSLLSELFPRLDEAFRNTSHFTGNWYKEKRIASPDYFSRYFSYSVIKGQVSDIQFNEFIDSIDSRSTEDLIIDLKRLIDTSSMNNFLHKIRIIGEDIPWVIAQRLMICIALSGDIFDKLSNGFFSVFDSPRSQAAMIIHQIIKKHDNRIECFEFAKELISIASPFDFAYDIIYWLRLGKNEDENIFNKNENRLLGRILIDRAIEVSGEQPIFITFPDCLYYLLEDWKETDSDGFNSYFRNILDFDSEKVGDLITALTSSAVSTNHSESFKIDFTKDQYTYFTNLFDKDYIFKLIMNAFGEEIKTELVRFTDRDNTQTEINILRQYVYWYENKDKESQI